jgi:hypothetical protein
MWDHLDLMKGPCTPTCCTLCCASFFCFLLAGSEQEPPVIGSTSFGTEAAPSWLLNEAISSESGSEFTGGGRQCWGLVLKCYESRTRQHKMLNNNDLRRLKHHLPTDLMNFGRRSRAECHEGHTFVTKLKIIRNKVLNIKERFIGNKWHYLHILQY